jgi:hypothetical protein
MKSTNNNIVQLSGKTFQKFVSQLTGQLIRPKTKFISHLLCGVVFTGRLVLTNIASAIPQKARLSAIANRFRRQLLDNRFPTKLLLFNYLRLLSRRLDIDSLFIVDLSDLAKAYAKKMENIALVRDGEKHELVSGYWLCLTIYSGGHADSFFRAFQYCLQRPLERTDARAIRPSAFGLSHRMPGPFRCEVNILQKASVGPEPVS